MTLGTFPDTAQVTRELEGALLLGLVRAWVNGTDDGSIDELLGRGPDWKRLAADARRHGVVPLILRVLSPREGSVPVEFLEDLRRRVAEDGRRSLWLAGELARIARALDARGLPSLALKGPILAARIYGDLGLRPFRDLDILVRQPDLARAAEVLVELGYLAGLPGRVGAGPFWGAAGQMAFHRAPDGAIVELHWRPVQRYFARRIDAGELWHHSRLTTLADVPVRSPSDEDLFVLLCVHGAKHRWSRLGWGCDLALLIRGSPDLDWERIIERARRWRVERMLLLGIRICEELFGVRAPELASPAQQDPALRHLASMIVKELLTGVEPPSASFRFWTYHLRLQAGWGPQLLYLIDRATSPSARDLELFKLTRRWLWLYYSVRPLRLGMHGAQRLLGRAGGQRLPELRRTLGLALGPGQRQARRQRRQADAEPRLVKWPTESKWPEVGRILAETRREKDAWP